ncbi:MAG: hypothetical protein ACK2UH_05885, partial [Candidatus Promineifilaceae bacterium]
MQSRKPYGTLYVLVAISVSLGLLLQVTGAAFSLAAYGQSAAAAEPQRSRPAAVPPLELAPGEEDQAALPAVQSLELAAGEEDQAALPAVGRPAYDVAAFRPQTALVENAIDAASAAPVARDLSKGVVSYAFMSYRPPQMPAELLPDFSSVSTVEPSLIFGPLASLFSPALLSSNSLGEGWNLVSLPEEVADTTPAAVLASVSGSYDRVVAYDGCNAADPWKVYDPADAASSDLAAIDHTIGFWINMTTRATLEVDGAPPAATNIPLCTGWNLIGYPLDQALPVSAVLGSIAGQYDRVFAWDADDGTDPWAIFDVNAPPWVNDLGQMAPGLGYWVHALQDTTLAISGPEAPPTVTLLTLAEGDTVTAPTTVSADITASGDVSWVLESRLAGETTWTEFASGTTTGGTLDLGDFDPTLQLNGQHEIRLTV